jgi:hypothetical protein
MIGPMIIEELARYHELDKRLGELADKQERGVLTGDEQCEQQKLVNEWERLNDIATPAYSPVKSRSLK